jgi:hypothetical protein
MSYPSSPLSINAARNLIYRSSGCLIPFQTIHRWILSRQIEASWSGKRWKIPRSQISIMADRFNGQQDLFPHPPNNLPSSDSSLKLYRPS